MSPKKIHPVLWYKGADFLSFLPSGWKCDDYGPEKTSAWWLDIPQRCLDPTQTLIDVCNTISWCLSGKHSSNIHIFYSRAGSVLWRKSGCLDGKRLTSSSQSPSALCQAMYTLCRFSENCIFDLVNVRLCCFIARCGTGFDWNKKLKSQSRIWFSLPSHQILKRLSEAKVPNEGSYRYACQWKPSCFPTDRLGVKTWWNVRSDNGERQCPHM